MWQESLSKLRLTDSEDLFSDQPRESHTCTFKSTMTKKKLIRGRDLYTLLSFGTEIISEIEFKRSVTPSRDKDTTFQSLKTLALKSQKFKAQS